MRHSLLTVSFLSMFAVSFASPTFAEEQDFQKLYEKAYQEYAGYDEEDDYYEEGSYNENWREESPNLDCILTASEELSANAALALQSYFCKKLYGSKIIPATQLTTYLAVTLLPTFASAQDGSSEGDDSSDPNFYANADFWAAIVGGALGVAGVQIGTAAVKNSKTIGRAIGNMFSSCFGACLRKKDKQHPMEVYIPTTVRADIRNILFSVYDAIEKKKGEIAQDVDNSFLLTLNGNHFQVRTVGHMRSIHALFVKPDFVPLDPTYQFLSSSEIQGLNDAIVASDRNLKDILSGKINLWSNSGILRVIKAGNTAFALLGGYQRDDDGSSRHGHENVPHFHPQILFRISLRGEPTHNLFNDDGTLAFKIGKRSRRATIEELDSEDEEEVEQITSARAASSSNPSPTSPSPDVFDADELEDNNDFLDQGAGLSGSRSSTDGTSINDDADEMV